MKKEEYKKLSIKEFTKAASIYESDSAGVYEMCKKDYPDILEELEREEFTDLLDAGCGPAPMIVRNGLFLMHLRFPMEESRFRICRLYMNILNIGIRLRRKQRGQAISNVLRAYLSIQRLTVPIVKKR